MKYFPCCACGRWLHRPRFTPPPSRLPNVILIVADELGYADMITPAKS